MMKFIFLGIGIFALGCDDYIFAGLLPGISGSFQSSISAVAQGISVYGIMYVGALPVCLFLLTKKPLGQVLLLALMTFIMANIITLLSTDLNFYLLGRAIAGLGAGLYLPLAIASAGELVDPTIKGQALGLAWACNSAGAVIGIPIGLWLANKTNWRVSIFMVLLLSFFALAGLLSQNLNLKVSTPPSFRTQARLLVDRGVMPVIGVTFLTAVGGLGLYVYTAPVLFGSAISSNSALTLWNIGGLIGNLVIGIILDRTNQPQWLMAIILTTLLGALLLIPVLCSMPVLGLLPFLIWGAMGWSTVTPQQLRLSQLHPSKEATLVALNSSAVSLGSVTGAALGGLALTNGLDGKNLPFAAAGLLFCALAWQVFLIPWPFHKDE